MSEKEFDGFVQNLLSEVHDRALGGGEAGQPDFKENAFTEVAIEYLVEIGALEGGTVAHFQGRAGRGIGKVSGFHLSEGGDRLEIFSSIFVEANSRVTVGRDSIQTAADRAVRFVDACLKGLHKDLEVSSDAHDMARSIHDARAKLKSIRVHILTDGTAAEKRISDADSDRSLVRFEIWDAERLFRCLQSGLPRDEILVDFGQRYGSALPCLPMPDTAYNYTAYLAVIPGDMLYDLYDEYGSRLLEYNVRSYLQARGKVNRGIRDTLKSEPQRFFAYNNGIVVTVDELELVQLEDGRPAISRMRGMQIVNGGQTTASVHRARKIDKIDISSVQVPAKITVVEADHVEEMVRHISLYANTQNVIQMADFSANDPFHVRLEQLSESVWCPGEQKRWFYERARGQYQVALNRYGTTPARRRRFREQTPPARKFTKTDVAKFVCSWNQEPHQVSKGAQKNFILFMQDYIPKKGRGWEPDSSWYRDLVAKAILFKAAQKLARQEKFPAYRANLVTFLVAYLSRRSGRNLDLSRIWEDQAISSQLEDLMRSWSHRLYEAITESAEGRNVTEWAKKEDCWKAVRDLNLEIPSELPPELTSGGMPASRGDKAAGNGLTPIDYENIARCKAVGVESWLLIYGWGSKTGLLEDWQCGIVQTLSSYAAAEWKRSPSPKQAKHAVKILDLADEHDVAR